MLRSALVACFIIYGLFALGFVAGRLTTPYRAQAESCQVKIRAYNMVCDKSKASASISNNKPESNIYATNRH